jgi:hypothetical protein
LIEEIRKHTEIPVYLMINGNYERNSQAVNLQKFLVLVSKFVNIYPVAFANLWGCSALWNSGIELADAKNYLILNNDIHVSV